MTRKRNVLCIVTVVFLSMTQIGFGFIGNNNGTVSDPVTGLTWQQQEAGEMTWDEALVYGRSLSLAGYHDWRLPNIKELHSLNNDQFSRPSLDRRIFPDVFPGPYWSSTPLINLPAKAWLVDFKFGMVIYEDKTRKLHVRCVRGGRP